ncbi:MAG: hypothetical protein U0936_18670 [Planctomycetaceae bacterium]
MNSYAYRLNSARRSLATRATLRTFARFYARRLPAEVILDGTLSGARSANSFSGMPSAGTEPLSCLMRTWRLIFWTCFGRPARMSACE